MSGLRSQGWLIHTARQHRCGPDMDRVTVVHTPAEEALCGSVCHLPETRSAPLGRSGWLQVPETAVLGWAGEILDGSDPALTLAVPPLQELELVEDVWRGEAQDLLSQIAQLQEENKQLMSNLNHKDVGFSEEEFQKQEGEVPRPRRSP